MDGPCFKITLNRHLGYFYLLAVVNNAAVNMGVKISLHSLDFSSFECIPTSGIAGSCGSLFLIFFLILFIYLWLCWVFVSV